MPVLAAAQPEVPATLPEVTLPTLPELPAAAADAARSALETALDRAEQALSQVGTGHGEVESTQGEGQPEVVLPELPALPDNAGAAQSALDSALDNAMQAAQNGIDHANSGAANANGHRPS